MVNMPLAYGASIVLAGLMACGLVGKVKQGFRKLA